MWILTTFYVTHVSIFDLRINLEMDRYRCRNGAKCAYDPIGSLRCVDEPVDTMAWTSFGSNTPDWILHPIITQDRRTVDPPTL